MRLPIGLAIAVLLLIPSGFSERPTTFCELLKNPEKYNGKAVRVRATWAKGPEWSALYCLNCSDKGLVWLDLRTGLDDASTKALRQIPMPATANLTVQGIFMSGGHYGHMGEYPYQLVARTASDAAIVWSGAPFTAEEKEAVKQWACGGTNPK